MTLDERGQIRAPKKASSEFENIFPLKEPSKSKTRNHFLFYVFQVFHKKAFNQSVKESKLCNITEMFSNVYHHIKCHRMYFIRWAISLKELYLQDLKSSETPKREYWRCHLNLSYLLYACTLFKFLATHYQIFKVLISFRDLVCI